MSGILNLLLGSAAGVIKDAYFNLVTLLLNTTATNGAQNNTFLDSSTNNFSITRNGNTTQGTFTPFSQTGWSNYFPSAAYFTVPNNAVFNLGSNDFTIECWYLQTADNSGASLISQWQSANDANSSWQLMASGSTNTPQFTFNVTSPVSINSSTTTALNTWYHLAAVRNGGTITLYLNGVSVGSSSVSGSIRSVTNPVGIAARGGSTNDSQFPGGYISNARVVNGTAVYTAAFTPPTIPLTAITNTVLLTSQSNRFVDNSTTASTITLGGTPSVQAFSPFAPTTAYSTTLVGGSGYFDGNGDYLTAPNNSAWDFGSGDFTVEMWVYIISKPSTYSWFALYGDSSSASGSSWSFGLENNTLDISFFSGSTGTGVLSTITTWNYNSWVHVAATRSGNTIRLFTNGALVKTDTYSSSLNSLSTPLYIGSGVGGSYCNGYLSGLRIIKGSALYTSAFTPPTAPPTAVTNTQLLLNYTNAGIFDAAAKNDLETGGNLQVSTTQAKFGATSMYFDGSGDYGLMRDTPLNIFGTSDFTIEAWVNTSQNSSEFVIIDFRDGNGLFPMIAHDSTNGVFYYLNSGYRIISSTVLNTGTWYHIAVSRSGSSTKMFINGTQVGSTYTDSSSLVCGAMRPALGINGVGLSSLAMTGYLDELRITRYARYTANFTAPAAAFPVQ
jgi:hypothetical protein